MTRDLVYGRAADVTILLCVVVTFLIGVASGIGVERWKHPGTAHELTKQSTPQDVWDQLYKGVPGTISGIIGGAIPCVARTGGSYQAEDKTRPTWYLNFCWYAAAVSK